MFPFRGLQFSQWPLALVLLMATGRVLLSVAATDCNAASVKKMMQLFTDEFASECTPDSLNKLIDYYGDLRNGTNTSGCKKMLKNEMRKTIVDKLAYVINKVGEQPEKLEQLQHLVKRVDRGIIVSSVDAAYWSADNRQTLNETLQRLDEGVPRVLALKALQQLEADNGDAKQDYMKQIIMQSDIYKTLEGDLQTCRSNSEKCAMDTNSYPPKEILTALKDLEELNKRCQGKDVQEKVQQVQQETRNVYRRCYIKFKKTIQQKVNVFKKLEQSALQPSVGTCDAIEVKGGIRKFERALKYINSKC